MAVYPASVCVCSRHTCPTARTVRYVRKFDRTTGLRVCAGVYLSAACRRTVKSKSNKWVLSRARVCESCMCECRACMHWCGINTFLHHRTRRRRHSHSTRKCACKTARRSHTAHIRQAKGGRTHARMCCNSTRRLRLPDGASECVCVFLRTLNGCDRFLIKSKSYGNKFDSRSYFYAGTRNLMNVCTWLAGGFCNAHDPLIHCFVCAPVVNNGLSWQRM